ncbi:pyridoxal phosphate enzyme, YggS family [Synechococcus sp. PCC 7502]|nr:pyridoxal phosphate enzyme, YggS family [Synechococcus sp. PCC 7502]
MNSSIADRIFQIKQEIPPQVKLIAVSKYATVEAMREAYSAGIRDFGESRVQEAIAKKQQLQNLADITWHMIGTLQSNKARQALLNFDWIHAVDRLSLAQQLDRLILETNKQIKICLQVKPAHDPRKFGWSEQELIADLPALDACPNLQIMGLMTILPQGLDKSQSLNLFKKVADLKARLQLGQWQSLKNLRELSMGMSMDYDSAIASGATMIRVGSKIFG